MALEVAWRPQIGDTCKAAETDYEVTLKTFKRFDLNGNGFLSEQDLYAILGKLDPGVWTKERVRELFGEVDRNGDGKIQFKEFLSWTFATTTEEPELIGSRRPSNTDPAEVEHCASPGGPPPPVLGLEEGRRLEELYDLGDCLGEGSFATVRRAVRRATGESMAVKSVAKDAMSKMRQQVPDAELVERREAFKETAGDKTGSRPLGILECPADNRVSRLEVAATFTAKGPKRRVVTVIAALRRGERVLQEAEIFELNLEEKEDASTTGQDDEEAEKSWHGTASRTFPARDGLIFRAQPGDVFDFKCAFRFEKGGASDGEHPLRIEEFVAKLFAPSQVSEFVILKSLDHPNIVKVWDVFEDFRHLHICMELCEGGELFDAILEAGRLTEPQAVAVVRQVGAAAHHMHARGLMHRDLRLENLMLLGSKRKRLEDNVVKVIDLGLARNIPPLGEGSFCTTKVGSPHFSAPELLRGRYREAVDVWSLGVIAYVLLSGSMPFDGETDLGVIAAVKEGTYSFDGDEWAKVSDRSKDFIARCLMIEPAERASASQALAHPWLSVSSSLRPADARDCDRKPSRLNARQVPNMRNYWGLSNFKRAAFGMLAPRGGASGLGPGLAARDLLEIFESLDVDHSGELTLAELRRGLETAGLGLGAGPRGWRTWLQRTFGGEVPEEQEEEEDEHMRALGGDDETKKVSYRTFLASILDRHAFEQEDTCWLAFSLFDKNGKGRITIKELGEVLRDSGVQELMDQEAIEAVFEQVDLNCDGEIDFYEFVEALRRPPVDPSTSQIIDGFYVSLEHVGLGDMELVPSPFTRGRFCVKKVGKGGAVWYWNECCAGDKSLDKPLKPGDEIVSVNGEAGSLQRMLVELRACVSEDRTMRIHAVRWSQPPF